MSLIALLDETTIWGRQFSQTTWINPNHTHEKQKIGICWASNPQDRTMHVYKSSTPQRLLSLQHKHHPLSQTISLQTDEAKVQEKLGLIPARPEWSATLQSIARCNAVISVDTAVAHLAAGSGQPVHLLLGNPPDWRWRPVPDHPSAPLWYPKISIEPLHQS